MQQFMFYLIYLAFFLPISANCQSFSEILFQKHDVYKNQEIKTRRFKYEDIAPTIKTLSLPFEVKTIGESIEGRAIYLVKIGRGKTKVLLWSQMHGDESTATMALMDIFNFFQAQDQLSEYKNTILDSLTLYFIPMLNPDGADKFRRRNALNIDLNRDALRLQTPEGKILKKIRDDIEADWGFNLHDQSRYYSVGTTNRTATISFLAPAYNYEKAVNSIRKRAMQQIGLMNQTLQTYMPGHVAKYNDTFEPRAFGDNIQKWGTSTILIESGGYKKDREKQFIRKMNFVVLLTSFHQIALKSYQPIGTAIYESIPFNGRYFHELIIRKATLYKEGRPFILDLAFRKDELQFNKNRSFYNQAYISDIGDLSTYHGYEELNANGYTIVPGKVYPKTIKHYKKLKRLNIQELLQNGYTSVRIKNLSNQVRQLSLPIDFLSISDLYHPAFNTGANPSFFLEKAGKKEMVIINGQVFKKNDKNKFTISSKD